MDLLTLVKVVLGRWRVFVPILIVTFGLAYVVQSSSPPLYQGDGYLVLESPEFAAADETGPVIDPIAIAEDVELEGDTSDRNFTVTLLGGANYAVAAAAPSEAQAQEDAQSVVDLLARRIEQLQEEGGVAPEERVELRLADPQVLSELQSDESWVATATVLLDDPALTSVNPYLANSSTGRLLQVWFQGDAAQAEFAQQTDGNVGVTVGQEARDAAPLLQVVTFGADPGQVIDGFYVAQEILASDLRERQERAGVLPSGQIRLAVLNAPLEVTDESPPVERTAVAVVALGGLVALGAALTSEVLDRRRRGITGRTGNPIIDLLGPVASPRTEGEAAGDRGEAAAVNPPPSPPPLPPPDVPMPRVAPEPPDPPAPPDAPQERGVKRQDREPASVSQARSEPANPILEEKLQAALAQRSVGAPKGAPPPTRGPGDLDDRGASGQRGRASLSPVPNDREPDDRRPRDWADQAGP